MKNLKWIVVVVVLVIAVLILVNKINQPASPPKTTVVRIGYLPSLAASSMYAAIAQGYFKEENLDVRIQEVYSGPDLVNALQGNAIDIAFGILPPLILARANGLPIKSIVGSTIDGEQIREHRIMLPPDSAITQGSDLKGKKIAVVAQGTSDYFSLLQYLEKQNLKENDVEIIAIPHPEMIFAVSSKAVDAGCGIEPFITIGRIQGKIKIFDFYYPDDPTEIGTYLAHESFINGSRDVVTRFVRAIKKGNVYCNDHAKLRALLPNLEKYGVKFKVSTESASEVTIMQFKDTLTVAGVTKVMNQLLDHQIIKQPIDVTQCIYKAD